MELNQKREDCRAHERAEETEAEISRSALRCKESRDSQVDIRHDKKEESFGQRPGKDEGGTCAGLKKCYDACAFHGTRIMTHPLQYNQTWEDYSVDQAALEVNSNDTVLLLTSAGCNVLNTLLEDPRKMYAVDTNEEQQALCAQKINVILNETYEDLWAKFSTHNKTLYRRGAYGCLHWVHWYLHHVCPSERLRGLLDASTIEEQGRIYTQEIEPRMWRGVRWTPIFLFAVFGVHTRQIWRLMCQGHIFLGDVAQQRLYEVMRTTPIRSNYFWCQVFGDGYYDREQCPRYLRARSFEFLKAHVHRIELEVTDVLSFLLKQTDASIDKINLLDAPEFCSRVHFQTIWQEVARVLTPGGRVMYRSFSYGYFPETSLAPLSYQKDLSEMLSAREMTASYAQVYVFVREGE